MSKKVVILLVRDSEIGSNLCYCLSDATLPKYNFNYNQSLTFTVTAILGFLFICLFFNLFCFLPGHISKGSKKYDAAIVVIHYCINLC